MTKTTEIDINKLRELEMLSSIVRSADNPILILEKNGEIKWFNKAFKKLHNYESDDSKNNLTDNSSDFLRILNETDSNFFLKNNSLSFTRKILTLKGESKWVQSTMTPIKDKNNKIEQFIIIEADVTNEKEVEEELIQRWENTQTLTEHLESVKDYVEDKVDNLTQQKKILQEAKDKSEQVLNKVLPYEIAIQLKKKGYASPRNYKKVTVININIRNFTELSNIIPIDDLVKQLHESLVTFDTILEEHFVEKIKSIGGVYIGAGGVPLRNRSNPIDVVLTALEIRNITSDINKKRIKSNLPPFILGFGIHTGKIIAGVVGKNKLAYDIWGDTVNIASYIENNSSNGEIIISEDTYSNLNDYFDVEEKTNIKIKETSTIKLFKILRIKAEFADDINGIKPNAKFSKILSRL